MDLVKERALCGVNAAAWTVADIDIALDAEMADDPVMTAWIRTRAGELTVMAEFRPPVVNSFFRGSIFKPRRWRRICSGRRD